MVGYFDFMPAGVRVRKMKNNADVINTEDDGSE